MRIVKIPGTARRARWPSAAWAASLLTPWCLQAAAQVPPGATPGGALPRVEPAVQPARTQGDLFDIPRVYDRPLGARRRPAHRREVIQAAGRADRARARRDASRRRRRCWTPRAPRSPRRASSSTSFRKRRTRSPRTTASTATSSRRPSCRPSRWSNGEVVVQVLEGRLAGVRRRGQQGLLGADARSALQVARRRARSTRIPSSPRCSR